jgi:ribonuclease-3
MEEEPTMLVPDPEKEQQDFMISEASDKRPEVREIMKPEGEPKDNSLTSEEEFDLSDITHKEKSREDIIAEAEAAAFGEE